MMTLNSPWERIWTRTVILKPSLTVPLSSKISSSSDQLSWDRPVARSSLLNKNWLRLSWRCTKQKIKRSMLISIVRLKTSSEIVSLLSPRRPVSGLSSTSTTIGSQVSQSKLMPHSWRKFNFVIKMSAQRSKNNYTPSPTPRMSS